MDIGFKGVWKYIEHDFAIGEQPAHSVTINFAVSNESSIWGECYQTCFL